MKQTAETLIQQIPRVVHLNYLIHVPQAARQDPLNKQPLILFLHGGDERGDDIDQVKIHGIPKVVEREEDFPFITVSPQCPENTWWVELTDALDALLVQVISRQPVDLNRIYLTGISMGGYGTWHWSTLYPDRFAAIAPICGGGPPFHGYPERICALKKLPVWAFHGAKDEVVPLTESEVLVETLKKCGGNVRFTVYPDAGHDSWTQTYDNPDLYSWLLEHKRIPVGETRPAGETPVSEGETV
jgi:predicted peptidase